LVSCHIEDARDFDSSDPSKSQYQAQKESVRDLNSDEDGIEIVDVPSNAIDSIHDLVAGGCWLDVHHPAPRTAMLRWRGSLYWPFKATDSLDRKTGIGQVSFAPANPDMYIYMIGAPEVGDKGEQKIRRIETSISLSKSPRSESGNSSMIAHEIMLAPDLDNLLGHGSSRIHLEPLDQKLIRLAKHCTTRKKRKELRDLLDEIGTAGQETEVAQEVSDAVERMKTLTDREDTALDALIKALVESGHLGEDRLNRVETEYATKYIESRQAQLEATAEAKSAVARQELRELEARLEGIRVKIDEEEASRRTAFEAELSQKREHMLSEVEKAKTAVTKEKTELDRQKGLLEGNLKEVTRRLQESGDEVVNQYLAIAPLLGTLGPAMHQIQPGAQQQHGIDKKTIAFEIPAYVSSTTGRGDKLLDEREFFERFCSLVDSCGFSYQHYDLKRYHLSVKTGQLTVLGGPSGIGKSSLPLLYSRALLGDQSEENRSPALMVNVSPSWMDGRDLIGHVNTFEGRFYPGDTGLFQRLVYANEEFVRFGERSGIYLICMDEMNLAQIEHYFSDFMLVLERTEPDRYVNCFSKESVSEDDPLRSWHKLKLPRSVRFVGTVNFDETTRALSDRLLDRVDLIQLSPPPIPKSAESACDESRAATGPAVNLRNFRKWTRSDGALPPDLGAALDDLRPILTNLNSPLSPRTYRGICRFVGSAEPILSAKEAFDAQVAQRIIPRLRNIYSESQVTALDTLIDTMENCRSCDFEESLRLLGGLREQARRPQLGFGI